MQRLRAVADAARAWRDAIGREDATATAWLAARDCGSQDDGSRAPYEAACADVQRHRAALDAALAALDAGGGA